MSARNKPGSPSHSRARSKSSSSLSPLEGDTPTDPFAENLSDHEVEQAPDLDSGNTYVPQKRARSRRGRIQETPTAKFACLDLELCSSPSGNEVARTLQPCETPFASKQALQKHQSTVYINCPMKEPNGSPCERLCRMPLLTEQSTSDLRGHLERGHHLSGKALDNCLEQTRDNFLEYGEFTEYVSWSQNPPPKQQLVEHAPAAVQLAKNILGDHRERLMNNATVCTDSQQCPTPKDGGACGHNFRKHNILLRHQSIKKYLCPVAKCPKPVIRTSPLDPTALRRHLSSKRYHGALTEQDRTNAVEQWLKQPKLASEELASERED